MSFSKTVKKTTKEIFTPPDYKKLKEANKKYPDVKKEIKGVGGWLLLFVVILIGNTLYFLYDLIFNFYVVIEFPIMWIALLVELLIIILFGLSLVYLFKHNKKGVEILKYALWLPLANYILIYLVYWLLKIDLDEEFFYGFVRNFIFALIWFLYLTKSKRVYNTYYKK